MRRVLLAVCAVIALAGCSSGHWPLPLAPVPTLPAVHDPPRFATTPQDVATLLRAAWVGRDTAQYRRLFTGDYEFTLMDIEQADAPPLHRDDELRIAGHLFATGTSSEPSLRRIDLAWNSLVVPVSDQRPGKTAPFHQEFTVQATLKADLGEAIWYVQGQQRLFVVRGDSADVTHGFPADSTHWYLERWEEGASSSGGAIVSRGGTLDTQPTARHTWSQLKILYW
jgi:hypothetical protein